MMHETSDLSFDELVDAACEELDLELNRPPPPPPPPTRREKLARWCRRILQDRLKPPIQRTARLATTVLNAELPVDVDAVSGAALSLTARVAHAGFRTLRWTLLAPLAPIAFARRRLAARRDGALPLHAPARPAAPARPRRDVPAPVALTPDAEAPTRPPASAREVSFHAPDAGAPLADALRADLTLVVGCAAPELATPGRVAAFRASVQSADFVFGTGPLERVLGHAVGTY